MTNNIQQDELQTLTERAKKYYLTVKSEIEVYQKEDRSLIIGLDPKGKRYWVGETESEVIQKKDQEGNKNLIYFMKLPAKKNGVNSNFCNTAV